MKSILLLRGLMQIATVKLLYEVIICIVLAGPLNVWSQGTIQFGGQVAPHGTNYYETGMAFKCGYPNAWNRFT